MAGAVTPRHLTPVRDHRAVIPDRVPATRTAPRATPRGRPGLQIEAHGQELGALAQKGDEEAIQELARANEDLGAARRQREPPSSSSGVH